MEIEQKENPNPNPNSTTSPPDSIAQISPVEPPIPLPRPLAPLPSVRPQNGDAAKPTTEAADSDEDGDASGLEYEISEESWLFREKLEKAKHDFLMKQRAAALAVPTNDKAVRSRLRRLGEPVTLFGEREMERRDRLRMIMAKLDSEGQLERLMKVLEEEESAVNAVAMEDGGGEEEGEAIQYPFYTEGSMALLKARYEIAKDSVVKAAIRLGRARRKRDDPDEDLDAEINWAKNSQDLNFSQASSENRKLHLVKGFFFQVQKSQLPLANCLSPLFATLACDFLSFSQPLPASFVLLASYCCDFLYLADFQIFSSSDLLFQIRPSVSVLFKKNVQLSMHVVQVIKASLFCV